MTTPPAAERTRSPYTPSGAAIALYAVTGIIWLGLAIVDFRVGRPVDRAGMQALAAGLSLFTMALNLSRWRKERRAS